MRLAIAINAKSESSSLFFHACPKCGSIELYLVVESGTGSHNEASVVCSKCQHKIKRESSVTQALMAWNLQLTDASFQHNGTA